MKNSHIQWTDHTWNPWEGCTKISPGCENCYAEYNADKRFHRVDWGPKGARRRNVGPWMDPYLWNREALQSGQRRRVFCASMADIFDDHPSIEDEWREHIWQTIRDTPCLDWLLLTKRPHHFSRYLPGDWGDGYRNVCLMVTAENQECAERRIPLLLETPAAFRGLSVEPLLGPVDLSSWIDRLDWVITGGESGHKARPMNPNWVREIRDLCGAHPKVSFFFKQWGCWTPEAFETAKVSHRFPDGEEVWFRSAHTLNGNHLDGLQHLAIPLRELVSAPDRELAEQALARRQRGDAA